MKSAGMSIAGVSTTWHTVPEGEKLRIVEVVFEHRDGPKVTVTRAGEWLRVELDNGRGASVRQLVSTMKGAQRIGCRFLQDARSMMTRLGKGQYQLNIEV